MRQIVNQYLAFKVASFWQGIWGHFWEPSDANLLVKEHTGSLFPFNLCHFAVLRDLVDEPILCGLLSSRPSPFFTKARVTQVHWLLSLSLHLQWLLPLILLWECHFPLIWKENFASFWAAQTRWRISQPVCQRSVGAVREAWRRLPHNYRLIRYSPPPFFFFFQFFQIG